MTVNNYSTACTNWISPVSCVFTVTSFFLTYLLGNLQSTVTLPNNLYGSAVNTCLVTLPPSLEHVSFSGMPGLRFPTFGTEWKAFCEASLQKLTSPLLTILLRQHMAFFLDVTLFYNKVMQGYRSNIVTNHYRCCLSGLEFARNVQKHVCLQFFPQWPWKEQLLSFTIKLVMRLKHLSFGGPLSDPFIYRVFMQGPQPCLTSC